MLNRENELLDFVKKPLKNWKRFFKRIHKEIGNLKIKVGRGQGTNMTYKYKGIQETSFFFLKSQVK